MSLGSRYFRTTPKGKSGCKPPVTHRVALMSRGHRSQRIQFMINGTLAADVGQNATISVSLKTAFAPRPDVATFSFCDMLDSVEQEEGFVCPPEKGDVEIMAVSYVPWVFPTDVNVTSVIIAETANKTRITCLNALLEFQ